MEPFYKDDYSALYLADAFDLLKNFPAERVDVIFADPPYFLSNGGKQMKDVWTGALTPPREKTFGKHPTQKPLYLLEKIILASTREGDTVLDPFCGSSTTGVACKMSGRKFIGVDNNAEFIALSKERLIHTQWKSATSTTG